jgi:hypothetical protein
VTLGFVLADCIMLGSNPVPGDSGTVQIFNSTGLSFLGGQYGVNFQFDGQGGTNPMRHTIQHAYIRTDLPGYADPTYAGGASPALVSIKNCYTPTAMWSQNN